MKVELLTTKLKQLESNNLQSIMIIRHLRKILVNEFNYLKIYIAV